MELLHEILVTIAEIAILVFEFIGVLIIIFSGLRGLWQFLRRDHYARLRMAKGMATALNFTLCGEILRTIVANDLHDLLLVGCVMLLRAGMDLLVHWDITRAEKHIMTEVAHHDITDDEATKEIEELEALDI